MKKILVFLFTTVMLFVGCGQGIKYNESIEDLVFEEVKADDREIYKYKTTRKINETQYDEVKKVIEDNEYEDVTTFDYSKQPVEVYRMQASDNRCVYVTVEFHGFIEFIVSETCDIKHGDITGESDLNPLNIDENKDLYNEFFEQFYK